MNRLVVRGLVVGIVSLTGTTVSLAQMGSAPRGYHHFAPRNRPSPAARARALETTRAKPKKKQSAVCCGAFHEPPPASPLTITQESRRATPIPVKADATNPEVQPVDWGGAEFGLNYGWPTDGYYPGSRSYGFGKAPAYPLHGYQSTYNWAGHSYSMQCYCDEGYPPFHCPGYRGECFVPGWNDAGTPITERSCGRGSCWDCLWHMGGYESPRPTIHCPLVCGTPSSNATGLARGFPRGSAGDPNYHPPRDRKTRTPPERSGDPYPPTPNAAPMEIPLDPKEILKNPPRPVESPAPTPNPQP
jgi:hypothetical protein